MSLADAARALHLIAPPSPRETASATGGRPARPRPGPVLMGDIHGARMGRPDLLLLWARWEEAARDSED
ncbi:hypothetical protein DLJ49_04700 [Rhodovulum sp. 12E13]|uniref:hypothetical protein n=1 Tax=Rhodovulum sp. 12E13 TaxID=2203891 RepID=UPI000E1436D2|nr:hypothetical protein [Rhodovulum sp. 12E13]RDC73982.1 hypothetical protein DLJ49_04700 [Rhodovulum sp. 12E13]